MGPGRLPQGGGLSGDEQEPTRKGNVEKRVSSRRKKKVLFKISAVWLRAPPPPSALIREDKS